MTEESQVNSEHLITSQPLYEKELENLIFKYDPELRFLAYKYVRDWILVDDIMQEVYLKAFLYINTFEKRSTIRSWLYKITGNQCIDYLRSQKIKNVIPTENLNEINLLSSESAEFEALQNFEKDILLQAVHLLPTHYRKPIILYHYKHHTYKEICKILNEDIGTIKNRIFRGRRLLKENLEKKQY
ncbi:RNA polymerase sigma factor [Bacillus sp. JJ1533]|uniref:RNA polymerase sigma factor n=1 Tax=Bacillus sp. JJ1533 TaxID=3122959 RepID=UPI002FFD6F2B